MGQMDLFGDAVPEMVPEPVLMALHAEYYDLIWQGLKTHEFRRRFLEGRPVRWFVYLNAPAGGETLFPNLDLTVAPEPGKFIAFPPLWLFPHAGLPPKAQPKYILHTYLCYPS